MLDVIGQRHPDRNIVEDLIRSAYEREYGAKIPHFPQCLVAQRTDGILRCAASLRFSHDGFFSENYLDDPIETAIGKVVGRVPSRRALVEVGSLASNHPCDLMGFVRQIIEEARSQGMEWAFFTATARLRIFLRRSGLPLIELGSASADKLAQADKWGSYYLHAPRVMLVSDRMADAVTPIAPTFATGTYNA